MKPSQLKHISENYPQGSVSSPSSVPAPCADTKGERNVVRKSNSSDILLVYGIVSVGSYGIQNKYRMEKRIRRVQLETILYRNAMRIWSIFGRMYKSFLYSMGILTT